MRALPEIEKTLTDCIAGRGGLAIRDYRAKSKANRLKLINS